MINIILRKKVSKTTRVINGISVFSGEVGYFDIPKTACTSIKRELYRQEHGKEIVKDEVGLDIHQFYNQNEYRKDISDCKFKFIVVRDPIKRFLSAYSNRVTYHKQLSYEALKGNNKYKGLINKPDFIFNPGLGQFLDNFTDYKKVWVIRHHIEPINKKLKGIKLSDFDRVYSMENIKDLEQDLSKRIGKKVEFGRHQGGGNKYMLKDLSRNNLDFLIDYYKHDYERLKDIYSVDDVYKAWRGRDFI